MYRHSLLSTSTKNRTYVFKKHKKFQSLKEQSTMMPRPQSRHLVVFPLGGRLLDEDEIIVHSCSFPFTRFEYLGIISRAMFPSVDSKPE